MASVFVQLIVLATFSPGRALAHGSGAHIMGKVRAVHGSTLSVEEKGGKEQTIALDAKTRFEKSGSTAAVTDLQVGERVVVHARKDGDKLVAETVKFGERAKSAPPQQGHDTEGKDSPHHEHSTK
jgi:hypothetical protein